MQLSASLKPSEEKQETGRVWSASFGGVGGCVAGGFLCASVRVSLPQPSWSLCSLHKYSAFDGTFVWLREAAESDCLLPPVVKCCPHKIKYISAHFRFFVIISNTSHHPTCNSSHCCEMLDWVVSYVSFIFFNALKGNWFFMYFDMYVFQRINAHLSTIIYCNIFNIDCKTLSVFLRFITCILS